MKESFSPAKPEELRALADELENYSRKMPGDPYARRWLLCAKALTFQADVLSADA